MLVRKIHLYLALFLGVWFSVLGLTGSWLVFYPEFDSWLHGFGTQATAREPVSWQRVLDASDAALLPGPGMTMIQLPFGESGPVMVMSQIGPEMMSIDYKQAYVEPVHARVLVTKRVLSADQSWRHNITGVAFTLHTALFMGAAGYVVVGIVGLFLLITLGAGVWMWWPRGRWRRAAFLMTSKPGSRAFLGDLHRVSGLYASAFLLILTLSGVCIGLRPYVEGVLSKVATMTPAPSIAHAHEPEPSATAPDLDRAVTAARERFLGRSLQSMTLMRHGTTMYLIALAPFDGAGRPVGATQVVVDPSGVVRGVRDPALETAADAVMRWQRPLHIGAAFGTTGRWVAFITGLLPLGFFVTGIWIWLRRKRRRVRATALTTPTGAASLS